MGKITIGDVELLTADDEFIEAPELSIEDLDLSRDAQLEEKRKCYRKYDMDREYSVTHQRYNLLRQSCKQKGLDLPLSRAEFSKLLHETEVLDEQTMTLTCLASLMERRDGTVTVHPYRGGLVIKYLDSTILDTSY